MKIEQNVFVNWIKTHYKSFWDWNLEKILILHWRWWSSNSRETVSNIICQKYNIIIPDLPWFWLTELKNSFDLNDYAYFVESFCKKIWLDDFILFGHSNWWAISIKLVSRWNLRIKKLILNNSAWIRNKTIKNIKSKILWFLILPFRFLNQFWFGKKIRNIFYKIIWNRDYLNTMDNKLLKETYLKVISEDLQSELQNINIKTFLIWWKEDNYTPISDGYLMQQKIKTSKIIVLDWQKHSIHIKDPKLLSENILNILKM